MTVKKLHLAIPFLMAMLMVPVGMAFAEQADEEAKNEQAEDIEE